MADIPNEGLVSKQIQIEPKNIEKEENLVMKFAVALIKLIITLHLNPFSAQAHRDVIGLKAENKQIVTESTLSKIDAINSSHIDSVNDNSYAEFSSNKTAYRTSSISNGKNENDTEILDFEYLFPIDSSNGDTTYRQYAPMSSANGEWDAERAKNDEIAKYRCLDSGQGCGSGQSEIDLNGNWIATKEGANFTGYKVIQKNDTRSSDENLLNANADGSNVGNGSISGSSSYNQIIGSDDIGFEGLSGIHRSEFEIVELPESFEFFGQSFSHIYVNENGFLTFGNGDKDEDKPWDNVSLHNANPHLEVGGHFSISMKVTLMQVEMKISLLMVIIC